VVSFTPLPLYRQYPLDKTLGGPKPAWTLWKRKKFLPGI
jgi:hypothetical protein